MSVKNRLAEIGLEIPALPQAGGNYDHAVQSGNMLYLSGKGPIKPDGSKFTGIVGDDVSLEEAYGHARLVGTLLLAAAQDYLGDLDRVTRVVKVFGMVRAAPDFGGHPSVINGCSDLFVEVFGNRGRHARSAVGMGSLPGGITVEIEAIFEIE